ncbi:hypothetical protein BISA_1422 [Bifidobacterium saguini DSM 23967]|uniref:Uncharacterized protein n=2 Tax=Bifidobacterium saguini TaxID=762210 RepID=A0A087DCT6_9BIFI|nr:hypothetical protein [Bifidobacterium saguini]KFI93336.1 hypothetical protein BISA_1422 [Bifidobacterium saguini DSM 23967]
MMHSWPHRSRSDFLDELETFQLQELVHDSKIETGAVFIALSYRFESMLSGHGWIPEHNPALGSYYMCLCAQVQSSRNEPDLDHREEMIAYIRWQREQRDRYDLVLHVVDSSLDSVHTWNHRYDFTACDRLRILAMKPSLVLLRHLLCAYQSRPMLYYSLEHHYSWARPLLNLPLGWRLRFGAELIEDIQRVIDKEHLRQFRIVEAQKQCGDLHISYESAGAGDMSEGQCAEMDRLIESYALLAQHVCGLCGMTVARSETLKMPVCVVCRDGGKWIERAFPDADELLLDNSVEEEIHALWSDVADSEALAESLHILRFRASDVWPFPQDGAYQLWNSAIQSGISAQTRGGAR